MYRDIGWSLLLHRPSFKNFQPRRRIGRTAGCFRAKQPESILRGEVDRRLFFHSKFVGMIPERLTLLAFRFSHQP